MRLLGAIVVSLSPSYNIRMQIAKAVEFLASKAAPNSNRVIPRDCKYSRVIAYELTANYRVRMAFDLFYVDLKYQVGVLGSADCLIKDVPGDLPLLNFHVSIWHCRPDPRHALGPSRHCSN